MNKNNPKLLCVGSVAYDSIKTPFGKTDKSLGGSASYFSLAARFFAKPQIVAVVGEDFKLLDVFKKRGIGVSGISKIPGKTFHWAGEYNFDLSERQTLKTELGVFANFKPRLSPAQKQSRYIFLANIHPKLQLDVLRQIKNPKFVGLDTMNYWIESALGDLKKVLSKVDVFIINDSEAREFSKQANLIKTAKKISSAMKKNSSLIIKRGGNGLLMFNNHKIFRLPAYPLEQVTDPTGAGDSFAGGFFGYLAKTDNTSWANLKKACLAGSVAASFCVEKLGTKRLLEIGELDITRRLRRFKKLVGFSSLSIRRPID